MPKRHRFLVKFSCVVVLISAVVVLRLFYLLLNGDDSRKSSIYRHASNDAHYNRRNLIVDAGNRILATNIPTYSLYTNMDLLENAKGDMHTFVKEMLTKADAFFEYKSDIYQLTNRILSGKFTWVKQQISPLEFRKYKQSGGIEGLGILQGSKRFYPYGEIVSDIVGYTNIDNKGMSGIEKSHDVDLISNNDYNSASYGGNAYDGLRLNINVDIQNILYKELLAGIKKYESNYAIGMIVDLENNNLVAAASVPSFDPNNEIPFSNMSKTTPAMMNGYVTGVYEFGSIMKVFTLTLALEMGIPLNRLYKVTPTMKIGKHTISDFSPRSGNLTAREIFIHSSNIGVAKIVKDIGHKNLWNFYKKLGFTERVITDLKTSRKPLLPVAWNPITAQVAGYGYGIAVTPMHILKAFCAILNGGIMKPINVVNNPDEEYKGYRVISKKTSKKMLKLLSEVVKFGTAKSTTLKNINIGGKTGTANKYIDNEYSTKDVLVSFISAFPIEDPKYAMMIMFNEPRKPARASGGAVAAPVSNNIIARLAVII